MAFLNRLKKYPKFVGLVIGIPLLLAIVLDSWLPYALLSHHKFTVLDRPPLLDTYGANAETLSFLTRDRVQISGWFIPAKVPSNRTLIVLHTRGGTRQDMLEFSLPLWQAGFNLALIDLRGHGRSGGTFFTFGYHEWQDVSGLLDYLEQRQQGLTQDVTLLGVSAGGAVAIAAAARDNRIQRLVSIAAFADLEQTIQQQVPWLPDWWRKRAIQAAERMGQFQVRETSPLAAIQRINRPVLIVHGSDDRYIPFEDGKALFAAAHSPKAFYAIANANHDTMLRVGQPELRQRILQFAGVKP